MADLCSTTVPSHALMTWLDNMPELRPFPAVATRVMAACEDPGASSRTLAQVIECDAALAMQLLRAANSSMYGFTGEIRTVEHASVVLGFRALKSLAVSFAGSVVFSQGDGAQREREDLWQHSLACATVARLLANHIPGIIPEEAFLSGIFHDVGKLVFLDAVLDEYRLVASSTGTQPLIVEEARVFGVDHQQVGQHCGEEWGLPIETNHAIGYHHMPSESPDCAQLVALINLANGLCKEWHLGGDTISTSNNGETVPAEQLGLDEETLAAVQEQAPNGLAETKQACGL